MNVILGIDPGLSGGFAFISEDGSYYEIHAFKQFYPLAITKFLAHPRAPIIAVFLEGVHAMPRMGVSTIFKFGENYGWWKGVLTTLDLPVTLVYPIKWQTLLNCRTGGDKRISKARAQELFPDLKITHDTADALLIAEYGRQTLHKK